MVDHEPGGRAEAPGPEPGPVAIPGQDEQIRAVGGGHHLALDAPPALDPGAGAAQPLRGRFEQLSGGCGGELSQARPGVALRMTAALRRAIHVPQARNRPSSSQSWASTSTAARKPTTGPSRLTSVRAACGETAPVAITTAAAGTAATASGQPRGRITAHASTASRAATETASAAAFRRLASRV
jgi:hypothetical protein